MCRQTLTALATLVSLVAALPATTSKSRSPTNLFVRSLNPSCAPGGNFDLSIWELQLPIGSTGDPDTISASQLEGCSGYQDSGHQYFFTESGDGALVMKVPGSPSSSGCVTTTNSLHCRTELRETSPSSWSPSASTNILTVSLAGEVLDDSTYGTVIGQVHISDSVSTKPVCELYYNQAGTLTMGVEQTRSGGDEVMTKVGSVTPGTQFTYQIKYQNNQLSVSINGGSATVLSTYSLDSPASYFKAGNYNQGSTASDIHFYSIVVEH